MKEKKSPTDEVKRLDDAIETEQAKASNLNAEIEERRKERERLQARCSTIAYSARADGDSAAVTELRDLRQRLRENDDETVDLQTAITETARRVNALRAERANAYRSAMRAGALLKLEELARIGSGLDLALYDVLVGVRELGQVAREADRLAREAGVELRGGSYRGFVPHAHVLVERFVRDEIEEWFHGTVTFLRKQAKRQGVPDSLEGIFTTISEGLERKEREAAQLSE